MLEKIILKNGSSFNGSVMETSEGLWLIFESGDLSTYFPILNNPKNTTEIRYEIWGSETVYTGYNHLFWIKEEPFGNVTAGLHKV